MNSSPLYNLIQHIEYGTNLHIGITFFKDYGNLMCEVPHHHEIHQSPVCDVFKTASRNSFSRCVRCRNLAVKKALTTKQAFGGLCVNGIYEYTHPVVIDGDVACIIFIGNIFDRQKGFEKMNTNSKGKYLPLDTLESNFPPERCQNIAATIDEYIHFLLEKYPDKVTAENPLIKNIKSYIETNLEFGVDIHTIASAFHYNPRYLGRLFKKETNMPLNEYIISRRLKRAKKLLKETQLNIIDISTEIGFNNVTYFNKLFKSTFGNTPTQYRKDNNKLVGTDVLGGPFNLL